MNDKWFTRITALVVIVQIVGAICAIILVFGAVNWVVSGNAAKDIGGFIKDVKESSR